MALAVLLLHHADCPLSEIDGRTLSGLQEWIRIEELSGRWTFLGVLHQTLRNYILEDRRESITLRELWRWLKNDLLE